MEPNYLSVEELDWELRIRGAVVQGNCDTKRSILRGHLQSERCAPVSHPEVLLDAEREKTICADKLSTLEALVTKFNFDTRHPDYKRLRTKLLHLKNRINYFKINDNSEANFKTESITKTVLLFDDLETRANNPAPVQNLVLLDEQNNAPLENGLLENDFGENQPIVIPQNLSNSSPVTQNHMQNNVTGLNDNITHPETQTLNNTHLHQSIQGLHISSSFQVPNQGAENLIQGGSHITENRDQNATRSTSRILFPPYQYNTDYNVPNSRAISNYGINNPNTVLNNNNSVNNHHVPRNTVTFNNVPTYMPFTMPSQCLRDINNEPRPNQPSNFTQNVNNRNYFTNDNVTSNHNNFQSDFSKAYFKLSQAHRNLLKFDGRNQTLHNFLERVEEFSMSHKIGKNQLLTFAHEFFEGDALILFRSIRQYINTWPDLVNELKSVFLPCDFEGLLWDAIRDRKQGVSERVLIFIAIMENLFKRFTYPVEEQVQLRLVIKNLRPYFQDRLALNYPRSIAELKYLCKALEEARIQATNFKEPSSDYSNIIGPELSYSRNCSNSNTSMYKQLCEISENQLFSDVFDEVTRSNINNTLPSHNLTSLEAIRTLKCFNCDEPGHAYNKCTKKKTIFCYGCGKKNITKPKCPNCSSKNVVTAELMSAVPVVHPESPTNS